MRKVFVVGIGPADPVQVTVQAIVGEGAYDVVVLDEIRGAVKAGLAVEPSQANVVLVHVGDGARFRRALLPHGFVVRECASFGLPGCVRIACRLLEAVRGADG